MRILHVTYILFLITAVSCADFRGDGQKMDRIPAIYPDYAGVTIPPNIAPLNFMVQEDGKNYQLIARPENGGNQIEITSGSGKMLFPMKQWKKLLKESAGSSIVLEIKVVDNDGSLNIFDPFNINVASETVDPYLAYRLIPPGYYSWSHIRIMQRCLEDFNEYTVVENELLDKNCVNCHSFAQNSPDRFMVHVRGSKGGTYFMDKGKLVRTDPKIASMPGSATYPSWHPGGRYVAYSSNQVRQSFYAAAEKSIEVFDLEGSMVLFDTKDNEIISILEEDTTNYLRTFPGWSPDGRYLYYCRAKNTVSASNPDMAGITDVHHDLVRKSFDEATKTFGNTEIVYAASAEGKSVSFPRISPDGKFLVFTLHDFGTFPIWHSEADLYSLDLGSGVVAKLDLNSSEAESYHSYSLNSRWLVFSSKRSDGRSTRPFISYMNPDGTSAKPFMLPQEDPEVYSGMIESFNIPEFVTGRITAGPRDFEAATKQAAIASKPGNESSSGTAKARSDENTSISTKSAHE